MRLTLSDVPADCRTRQYIMDTYNVSKTSVWRLLSGKVDHICPQYHVELVTIVDNAWDIITQPSTVNLIRNYIAYQIKKWGVPFNHLDDIAQECYIRAYKKSGIWVDMPERKKNAYLATLAKRTTNDYLKAHVQYIDVCKNHVNEYAI